MPYRAPLCLALLIAFVYAHADDLECDPAHEPRRECYIGAHGNEICLEHKSKTRAIPWREHPDGLTVDGEITADDLGFLMSNVLLECGTYVSEIRVNNDTLTVWFGTKEARRTGGYVFERAEKGRWRALMNLEVGQIPPNNTLQRPVGRVTLLAVATGAPRLGQAAELGR